ncbi:lipolytic protein g-d-s-l family [Methylobacterium sp. Leaf465]|uniref:SGNH/GDSL hydrolase family protein n=1 Tax=Methylobacterium sp. Leaf465 TaxID=1736385 RepID=UPI0006FAD40F|nr:GDSL-type esterase/lipase family protein [Methylobacterium sp. Leaf465]KQT80174.1 lipolytic protein g-d-s-l family [Methylobacterium sp. Leaf465]
MALPKAAGLLALSLALLSPLGGGSARAQAPAPHQEPAKVGGPPPTVVSPPSVAAGQGPDAEAVDVTLSPECRVPGSKLYTLARLGAVKAALKEKRPVRVLAIGASTMGLGSSATYPVKLETALERSLPDVDVVVESRGLQGEIASGAGERLRSMVAEVEPDLVIWQVGSHDALARVDLDAFGTALDETVQWIKGHEIDVVLVSPVYTASLASDDYYTSLVRKVQEVALREGVPLVQRYEAMRYLARRNDKGEGHLLGSQFRLNDLGLRCMAEHVTRAITLSLLQPDPASTGSAGRPALTLAPPKESAGTKLPATAPAGP